MFARRVPSALLIDFDNLVGRFGQPLVDNIERWMNWLQDGGFDPAGQRRDFLVKRVYWFTDHDIHRADFLKQGIDITISRAVRNKEKASSADFDITIDAVELKHRNKRVREVIILSFDGDFLTVLNHLQLNDYEVGGMAAGQDRPAKAYRRLADFVIEKEAFEQAFAYERPQRGWFSGLSRSRLPAAPSSPVPQTVAEPRPASPRTSGRVSFDLKGAARVAAEAAAQAPSAYLSKRFVTVALQSFPGFRTSSPHAWLGCGTYQAMIEKLASLHPNLAVTRLQNGALVLVYRGPEPSGAPVAAPA